MCPVLSYVMAGRGITIFWNWSWESRLLPSYSINLTELGMNWGGCGYECDWTVLRKVSLPWRAGSQWGDWGSGQYCFLKRKAIDSHLPVQTCLLWQLRLTFWSLINHLTPFYHSAHFTHTLKFFFIPGWLGKCPSLGKPIRMTPPSHCILLILE